MTAELYLQYLIDTAKMFEAGTTTIGVQKSELEYLKALMEREKNNSILGAF